MFSLSRNYFSVKVNKQGIEYVRNFLFSIFSLRNEDSVYMFNTPADPKDDDTRLTTTGHFKYITLGWRVPLLWSFTPETFHQSSTPTPEVLV